MNDQGSEDVRFDLEVSRNLTNDLKKQLRKVKKEMLDLRQAKKDATIISLSANS